MWRQRIQVTDEGVAISSPDGFSRFGWDAVEEIAVYKCDCLTFDDVRLVFQMGDSWVEVSEEVEGWIDLVAAVERHFPSIPTDWFRRVSSPAFATNDQILFKRTP